MAKGGENINLMKLKSISNEAELGIIESILKDENIPYIVKDHGAGGHMRIIGTASMFPTDIMVEEAAFNRAKTLLESIGIDVG